MQNMEILHQFIISDHRPVAAIIKTTTLPQTVVYDDRTKHEKKTYWNKAAQQQKLKYQQASKIWLSEIPFEEIVLYDNSKCKNALAC